MTPYLPWADAGTRALISLGRDGCVCIQMFMLLSADTMDFRAGQQSRDRARTMLSLTALGYRSDVIASYRPDSGALVSRAVVGIQKTRSRAVARASGYQFIVVR